MREVAEDLAARIESGAARLCHVWILRPRGGAAPMGFTDHDRDLNVEGVVCVADGGMTGGAMEQGMGPAPGSMTVNGVLDDARLDEAGVLAGRFDGAGIEAWRVDWERPDLRVRLWSATVSRIIRSGAGFTAELDGPAAALERVVGRTYGRMCDAALGDGRCRAVLAEDGPSTCDKRWSTCVEVFDNGANFQGFPDIPGDDFLTVHPVEGGRHDGGSRR